MTKKTCLSCARCGPSSRRGGRIAHTCPRRAALKLEVNALSKPLGDCWRARKLPFTDPLPKALPAELL